MLAVVPADGADVPRPETVFLRRILDSGGHGAFASKRSARQEQGELHVGNGVEIEFVLLLDLGPAHVEAGDDVGAVAFGGLT